MDGASRLWTSTIVHCTATSSASYQRTLIAGCVNLYHLALLLTIALQLGEPVEKTLWGELEPEEGLPFYLLVNHDLIGLAEEEEDESEEEEEARTTGGETDEDTEDQSARSGVVEQEKGQISGAEGQENEDNEDPSNEQMLSLPSDESEAEFTDGGRDALPDRPARKWSTTSPTPMHCPPTAHLLA